MTSLDSPRMEKVIGNCVAAATPTESLIFCSHRASDSNFGVPWGWGKLSTIVYQLRPLQKGQFSAAVTELEMASLELLGDGESYR